MSPVRLRSTAIVVALLLVSAPVGQAQPGTGSDEAADEASAFFRAGRAAFERGDYPAAARAFEEADRRLPAAAAVFNAGRAWEAAEELARAANLYADALARTPPLDSALAVQARAALDALDHRVGVLVVEGPETVRIDLPDAEIANRAPPFEVRLRPSSYEMRITRPGSPEAVPGEDGAGPTPEVRQLTLAPGDRVEVVVTPEPPTAPAPAPALQPSKDSEPGVPAGDAGRPRRLVGWTLIGVGAAGALTGAGLGVAALRARDTFLDSNRTDANARGRAADLRLATNVVWGVSATAALVGVVLLLTSPDDAGSTAEDTTTGPAVTIGVAATHRAGRVTVRGRF